MQHDGLGMTPFKALYGRAPPFIVPFTELASAHTEVSELLQNRDELITTLRANLSKMQ